MADEIYKLTITLRPGRGHTIRAAYLAPDGRVYYSPARPLADGPVTEVAKVVMAKAEGQYEAADEARRSLRVVVK